MEFDTYIDEVMKRRGLPPLHKRFQSTNVTSDGIELHLDVLRSPGEASTIINIPGTAVYGMFYVELLARLGDAGFNVIGFDPRGHGRSKGIRGSYTIPELVEDACSVIDFAVSEFGPSVYLMGASQGGIVAFYTAAVENRLKGVICKNLADLGSKETADLSRNPWLTKGMRPFLNAFARLFPLLPVPLWVYIDLNKEKMNHYEDLKTYLSQDPWALKRIRLRALASLATARVPGPIEEISVPVMIMQSESDELFPLEYTRSIYDRLTCTKKLEVIPGGHGHLLFTESVDLVLPRIVQWIQEIGEMNS